MSNLRGLLRSSDGTLVGLIRGGEPSDGCALVELLIRAHSRMEIVERARDIGVWGPTINEAEKPTKDEANSALEDADGIVWRFWGTDESWRPFQELSRKH